MGRSVIVLLIICAFVAPASAQTSTGRHRSSATVQAADDSTAAEPERTWTLLVGAGLLTSGDLFRVRTTGNSGIPWDPPAGGSFVSSDFTVTLDESIALSASLGRRLADRLWGRLDFSLGQVPMAAIARVGESAAVYRWDELTLHQFALAVEYGLSPEASHPYLLGGVSGVIARGESSDDYDQERVGVRFGAGFRQRLARDWGLRVEIRDSVVALDFADYRPPVVDEAVYPNLTIEEMGPQHLWEILLLLQGWFCTMAR